MAISLVTHEATMISNGEAGGRLRRWAHSTTVGHRHDRHPRIEIKLGFLLELVLD